jgi:hypothetical protein
MPFKDLIGLILLGMGSAGGILLASLSRAARDTFFVLMIGLAPMTEYFDVNFVSRNFYRGTVRGFEVSLVDVLAVSVLVSAIIRPRLNEERAYWAPGLGFMLLFLAYCFCNVAVAMPQLFGLFELSKMLRGLTIFLAVAWYVRSERELRIAIAALGLVIGFEGLLGLVQRYHWGVHRVFGTLDHSNSLSAFFCITSPVLVAAINSRWTNYMKILCAMALALATVGVILTISRAGVTILALGTLSCVLLTMSWHFSLRKAGISLLVLICVSGLVAKSWETLKRRFQESTLDQEYGNHHNQGRGYYIRLAKAISAEHFLGVGLNNWSYWVSNRYGPRLGDKFNPYKGTDREPSYVIPEGVTGIDDPQAAPAHNLAALTVGELGIPGLILFGLVWLRWLQMGFRFLRRRSFAPSRQIGVGVSIAIGCMLLQSMTEWVYRHSPVFYTFNILVGLLASLYYQKCRVARSRVIESSEAHVFASEPPLRVPF